MLDRIKHTIEAARLEWTHGHKRRAFMAKRQAEREAALAQAIAALSKEAKATIKMGDKATDAQLKAFFAEIEVLPDAQMFEAGKALCAEHPQVVCRAAINDFMIRNAKRFAALAKL